MLSGYYAGGGPRRENVKPDTAGNPVPSEKEPSKRGRGTGKTPVIGARERSSGKVHAKVAPPNEKGQELTGKQLLAVLAEVCKDGTTVVSDDFSAGNGVHTNGIENFWSVLKRGWIGTYHHWSVKYTQRYVDEFCFRYGNRNNPDIFDEVLKRGVIPGANCAWKVKNE